MHPILFRIPLPHMPLKLWWALAAVAGISALFSVWSLRKQDRNTAATGFVFAIVLAVVGYMYRDKSFEAQNLPIYSYGVMLGLSLIVGWYLTLSLAGRDGLPKETMANCYVVTAIVAVIGSRILYIATNPDEFKEFSDVFALRRGGLVAYGGFLGGYLGSWAYLARNRIRLLPWADVAVPSLASGLFITRIGCYLFGCDFGTRLGPDAPAWLAKLGTFPHWTEGVAGSEQGSPAWLRHTDLFKGTPQGVELSKLNHSFPVHPTQLYESLAGLLIVLLLLSQRKNQKFRGQIFFLFTFVYGVVRFTLEIFRDDTERGSFGWFGARHVMIACALLLMALGFTFGIALGIKNERARTFARIASFVPPVLAFVLLYPASFTESTRIQYSTSQWVALLSAITVSFFYARGWLLSQKSPLAAMGPASLGEGVAEIEEKEAETAKAEKKAKKKSALKTPAEEDADETARAKKSDDEDHEDTDHDEDEEAPPSNPFAKGDDLKAGSKKTTSEKHQDDDAHQADKTGDDESSEK